MVYKVTESTAEDWLNEKKTYELTQTDSSLDPPVMGRQHPQNGMEDGKVQ